MGRPELPHILFRLPIKLERISSLVDKLSVAGYLFANLFTQILSHMRDERIYLRLC